MKTTPIWQENEDNTRTPCQDRIIIAVNNVNGSLVTPLPVAGQVQLVTVFSPRDIDRTVAVNVTV